MEHYINLFFSVSLHVLLLFIFLTIFYWLVISKTETNSLYSEIDSAINNTTKNVRISKNIFTDKVKNYFDAYFAGEDETYRRNNKQLLIFNIVIISLIFVTLLATLGVRYLICNKTINFMEIILENIFILIFVGIIEYYFFMNIASKFVPVLPSYLPNVVKDEINKL
jgi:hypothetical protein